MEERLTDSDCSHHWRHDDRESHSTSDHQVPLVVGDIFAFVAVMDLTERRGALSQSEGEETSVLTMSIKTRTVTITIIFILRLKKK